jgi:hypothetical protein
VFFGSVLKVISAEQRVLPDRSIFIRQRGTHRGIPLYVEAVRNIIHQ